MQSVMQAGIDRPLQKFAELSGSHACDEEAAR